MWHEFVCLGYMASEEFVCLGYMASEEFVLVPRDQLSEYQCQRCKMLTKHNMALNVAVTPQQYVDVVRNIGKVRVHQ